MGSRERSPMEYILFRIAHAFLLHFCSCWHYNDIELCVGVDVGGDGHAWLGSSTHTYGRQDDGISCCGWAHGNMYVPNNFVIPPSQHAGGQYCKNHGVNRCHLFYPLNSGEFHMWLTLLQGRPHIFSHLPSITHRMLCCYKIWCPW